MIPTNQLHQFYQVAKMGSIRKAARYLNKSQSAVSTAIKVLEDELVANYWCDQAIQQSSLKKGKNSMILPLAFWRLVSL